MRKQQKVDLFERLYIIGYGICDIIDGAVTVLTLGQCRPDLGWRLVLWKTQRMALRERTRKDGV